MADFLKSEPEIAIDILNAIESHTARMAVLQATAKATLPPPDFLLFDCTVASLNAQRSTRNEFAHHIWGISDQLPNALLLIDPRHLTRHIGEIKGWELRFKLQLTALPDLDRSRIFIWSETDLDEQVAVSKASFERAILLSTLVTQRFAGQESDSRRQQLLSDPLVQLRIERATKRSAPLTPQEAPP